MHWFLKFIFGIELYMFRTVPLSIIRSFSLYTQQWYMSYSLLAASGRNSRCTVTWTSNLSDFTVWRHTWRKNWVNCAVLTGNSAGPRTVLSTRLLDRELPSSLRESHTHSVQFFVQFFCTVKLHIFNVECTGPWKKSQSTPMKIMLVSVLPICKISVLI